MSIAGRMCAMAGEMCAMVFELLSKCVPWLAITGQMCAMAAKLLRKCVLLTFCGCLLLGKCVPRLPYCKENVCHRHAMATHFGEMCAMSSNCRLNVCHSYQIAGQMCAMAAHCWANVCHGWPLLGKCVPWLPNH